MTKYARYQDYVIRDGHLIGEFEQMYQDFDDPWEQSDGEEWASEKAVALNLIEKIGAERVLELGCGLGHYSERIRGLGVEVLGVDVAETAVAKAQKAYPDCTFAAGDVLDFWIYREFDPDLIVMAEVTWYVLEKLDRFLTFARSELPETKIVHLLTTYPAGVQQYGKDYFTNLEQIRSYFHMRYLEWGEIGLPGGCTRTYFLGDWGR